MKVPKEHLPMILSGALKTMRRPDTGVQPEGSHAIHRPADKRNENGRLIQPPAVCRIEIVDAVLEPLDSVTDDVARQEGYPDADTYRDEWCRFHNRAWTGEQAWTITFRIKEPKEAILSGAFRGSSPTRLFVNGVWEDVAGPEPEKVAASVVESLPSTLEARQRHARIKLDEQRDREAMPIGEIVARELAAAQAKGVDTTVYEQSILRRIRALRNRTEKAA